MRRPAVGAHEAALSRDEDVGRLDDIAFSPARHRDDLRHPSMSRNGSREVHDKVDACGDCGNDERGPVRKRPILAPPADVLHVTESASAPEPLQTMSNDSLSTSASRPPPRRRPRLVLAGDAVDTEPVLVGIYIRVSTAREEMVSPE